MLKKNNSMQEQIPFSKNCMQNENFEIGEYTYGKPTVFFDEDAKLRIGKFCSIAGDVTIFLGGNHRPDWISTYPFNIVFKGHPVSSNIVGHPSSKGDVIIKNDVWIGAGATILSGVTIGNGAVVGARSVVTRNIGDYEMWAGNPAKLIKKRFSDKEVEKLLELKWWDWDINKILNYSALLCSNNVSDIFKK